MKLFASVRLFVSISQGLWMLVILYDKKYVLNCDKIRFQIIPIEHMPLQLLNMPRIQGESEIV